MHTNQSIPDTLLFYPPRYAAAQVITARARSRAGPGCRATRPVDIAELRLSQSLTAWNIQLSTQVRKIPQSVNGRFMFQSHVIDRILVHLDCHCAAYVAVRDKAPSQMGQDAARNKATRSKQH
jgi:hypothetical protein